MINDLFYEDGEEMIDTIKGLSKVEISYNAMIRHLNKDGLSEDERQFFEQELKLTKKSVLKDNYPKLITNEEREIGKLIKRRSRYKRKDLKELMTDNINWSTGEIEELKKMKEFQERLRSDSK